MSRKATQDYSNRQKITLVVMCVVFGAMFVSLVRNLMGFGGLDQRIIEAEQELRSLRQEQARLQAEADRVESGALDEAYIRDKLGLVQPGESVVIIPQDLLEDSSLETEQAPIVSVQELPVWRKWVELFM